MTHTAAMTRIYQLGFVLSATLALSCGAEDPGAADPTGPTLCDQAAIQVEACLGAVPESPHSSCDAAAQANAQHMMDELALAGCSGPPEGKADSAFCKFMKWDPMGWCETPAEVLGPEPQGEPTQYPIILAHGFNTSTTNFWRFNDVDLALLKDRHGASGPGAAGNVVLGSVPPFDTPQVRAGFLEKQLDALLAKTGATRVNLVCFSAGGPDCRYLASPGGLNRGDQIASITTISSPHRGSYVADVATKALPGQDKSKAIDFLATLYGKTFSEVAEDSHIVAAFEAMSEKNSAVFNQSVVDHASVEYLSWAGVSFVGGLPHPKPSKVTDACRDATGEVKTLWHEERRDRMDVLLVGAAAFVGHGTDLRPNDGVSSVQSAKWGEFQGCIPADHLDQVGQIGDKGADKHTGFDYIRFYRNLAFDLAKRGH